MQASKDKPLDLGPYNLVELSVISSTQISSRVTSALSHLNPQDNAGHRLVCFRAKAGVASKLITIVEIVKRQLVSEKISVYQYNDMGSELVTIKSRPPNGTKPAVSDNDDEGTRNEEEGFQTMALPDTVRHLARSIDIPEQNLDRRAQAAFWVR